MMCQNPFPSPRALFITVFEPFCKKIKNKKTKPEAAFPGVAVVKEDSRGASFPERCRLCVVDTGISEQHVKETGLHPR